MLTTPGVSVALTDKDTISGKRALEVRVGPYSVHKNKWPYIALSDTYLFH